MVDGGMGCAVIPGLGAGICFGRTPLIKLSPKKTWEGFCGGLVMTVAAAWVLADVMSRYKWMVCPRTVRCLPSHACARPVPAESRRPPVGQLASWCRMQHGGQGMVGMGSMQGMVELGRAGLG